MKKLLAFAALAVLSIQAQAQILTGEVRSTTGELLTGATVRILPNGKGSTTAENGKYQLTLPYEGSFQIQASFIGFQAEIRSINISSDRKQLNFNLKEQKELLEAVNISAVRASKSAPMAKTDLNEEEIENRDEGRDIPFILRDLPSTVVSSDAGTGIGYTGIRIRGSDISRINVTVNGIPMNDPESHGVFWVNTPDLVSSTNSIQVQRGVGTSTNGAGAFGASINLKTTDLPTEPYAASELSAGSFNTFKANLQVGTGLINDHWAVEARLSKLQSEGFIDRASADLESYYLSGSYYSENTSVQLIHFGGGEETYQAWWGVPEAKLRGNDSLLQYHIALNGYDSQDSANLVNSDPRRYNYYTYENEVDNYKQDHYQLHISQKLGEKLLANAALHYTWGRGYYEQYRKSDQLSDYGLSPVVNGNDTTFSSDLIRRRWLNNGFAGGTYSLEYRGRFGDITLGGAYNRYEGDHYGEIIWARYASDSEIRDRYYDNTSVKKDFNSYLKANLLLNDLNLYADLQVRRITYTGEGIDADRRPIDIDAEYFFFNPKAGLSYSWSNATRAYASVAVAHREPVRTDFLDARPGQIPEPERLIDYEAGFEYAPERAFYNLNFYYMDYSNQLVQTGRLNDVGAAIRENVDESYRLGVEMIARQKLGERFEIGGNLSLSQNKIVDYTDYVIDYGTGGYETTSYESTDISFSPNVVGAIELAAIPVDGFTIRLTNKYVGQQYLDNTSSENKSLDAFAVSDLRLQYKLPVAFAQNLQLHLLVANLFDVEYAPNGYTYSYIYGSKVTENFYYPMAGINFMGGVKIQL